MLLMNLIIQVCKCLTIRLINVTIVVYSINLLLFQSSLGKVEGSGGAFNIIFNSLKAGLNGVKETVDFIASKVAQEASLGVYVCE
jgi:hypothetical protein